MADTNPSTANASNNARNSQSNNGGSNEQKPKEFNPRWKGYVYILLASLVNFSSVSNLELENNPSFQGMWQISLVRNDGLGALKLHWCNAMLIFLMSPFALIC
jgi:hypothetical protein